MNVNLGLQERSKERTKRNPIPIDTLLIFSVTLNTFVTDFGVLEYWIGVGVATP